MNIRALRMQFAIVLSLALTGCGGGGGGSQNPPPPPPPPPQSQTISFAQAGPLTLEIGATVTNTASGGGGTGAITYQSSDTDVLTVNATSGVATGVAVGAATVTATKAADAGFTQAQATYTVNVTVAQQAIAFGLPGPLTLPIGCTVTNVASGGGGSGAITYQSSNTSVLSIDPASGLATCMSVGSAIVTATKAADASFAQAQATYTVNVTLAQQAIAFTQPGPLTVLVGATLTNLASGGGGTGEITYASSDTSVLTINALGGIVTGVAKGTATVTATKAADATFAQAQATYTVKVRTTTPLTGFIGATSSQMHVPQLIPDQYWSARADTCPTPEGINTCPGADVIGGAGVSLFHDINATLTTPAYHALASGLNIEDATLVAAERFSERIGHAALFFKNRYWVIGGGEPQLPTNLPEAQHTILADVWSSADGKTWKLETDAAAFGPRWFHQAVVFKGAMWVISGARIDADPNTLNNFLTDIWSSTDGIHWTQQATDIGLPWYSTHLNVAVFDNEMWAVSGGTSFASSDGVTWTQRSALGAIAGGARGYASLTVFNGGLVYIGGSASPNADPALARRDVWRSVDGVDWFVAASNPPFSRRLRHVAFVMNDRLWIMGGQVPDGANGTVWALDAWSSGSSAVWTQESTGGLGATFLAQVVQQLNRVTLVGGVQRGYSSNVWQTTTGNDWHALSANAQFSPRETRGVSFQGHVWIIGGGTAEAAGSARSNQIWRSDNGAEWTRVATQGMIFSPRDGHSVVVFDDRLWVIGGWDGDVGAGGTETRLNDVWSSDDGVTWTQHAPAGGVIFAPVVGHDAVVFQNKLWVIGGNVQNETDSNEVWSSVDGDTWTQVTQVSPFTARRSHRVVEFNGEMWMIAGATQTAVGADDGTDDVWHSADGASWTSESAAYPPRARHALEVFNGRLYMIGGLSNEDYLKGTVYNDVWSSADGVLWQQETPVTPFPPRWNTALVHHGTQLWMIGGYGRSFLNDVWRSSDGRSWGLAFSHDLVVP
jgi:uncharacterized protein YjdB